MYEIQQQRTALVIPIREAEPYIQAFREKHIPTIAATMPPHITVYGPFIPMTQVDERLHRALTSFFASRSQFRFTLRRTGRFVEASALYLKPEPIEAFCALSQAIQAQFPEAPPDFYPNRMMHLTLARCAVEEMAQIESRFYRECGDSLPIEVTVREICLFEKRDGAWHERFSFGLGQNSQVSVI